MKVIWQTRMSHVTHIKTSRDTYQDARPVDARPVDARPVDAQAAMY